MKKLLVSLMAITIVSSSATSVVACGPITNAKLLARSVNTEVFRGTFKFPMTSWSTGSTIQNEDAIILAQLQDTLLTPNAYDQFEGSLAQWWGHDEKSVEWYFNVRDEAQWTGLDKSLKKYESKGQIGGRGFYDAFRFVLNPNNQSESTGSWSTIIAEGNEVTEFIEKLMKDYPEEFNNSKPPTGEDNGVTHTRTTKAIDAAIMYYNLMYGKWLDLDDGTNRDQEWATESKVAFDWKTEFSDANGTIKSEIKDELIAISRKNPEEYEKHVIKSMTKGGIIRATPVVDGKTKKIPVDVDGQKEEYNLTMRLQKPAPYFESLAGFLSLAPMPPISVDYSQAKSSYNYGALYQNIWSSGRYVVHDYGPSTIISLKTNPYYFNKDKTFIKKQIYSFVGNVDVSKPRLFFEAGDISEVAISPTDFSGWTKYVGEDFNNPVFEGAHDIRKPNTNSFFLLYNYNYKTGNNTIADSSLALSQNSVRAYISYLMERTQLAKYYSDAMDTNANNVDQSGKQISKLLRNIYTGSGFATYTDNDKTIDYTDHVEETYIKKMKETASEVQSGITDEQFDLNYAFSKSVADGYDAYRRNDLLALKAIETAEQGTNPIAEEFKSILVNQNQEIQAAGTVEEAVKRGLYDKYEAQKISTFQKQVTKDINKATGKNNVTLKVITNGNNSSTTNKALLNMTGSFNAVANNPIQIEEVKSTDSNNYITLRTKGVYDLMVAGWTPDYNDPLNFLHTLIYGGEYGSYQRYSKLFEQSTKSNILELKPTEYLEKSGKSELYKPLMKALENYTNEVQATDLVGDYKKRYSAFAETEYGAIFGANMILPLYVSTGATTMYLSYTNPFTRAAFPSGSSQYRLFGAKMTSQLMTKEIYNAEKALYDQKDPKYATHLWEYSKNSGKLVIKTKKLKGPAF